MKARKRGLNSAPSSAVAMVLIVILIVAVILFLIIKPYFIKYDTVVGFSGGLGTGKSFMSVLTAVIELRKARWRTMWYNLWHRKNKQPLPELYSSIPVRYKTGLFSGWKYSLKLTPEHLTLQRKIIPGSIVFLDEIDVFCNQFGLANPNIIDMANKKELAAKKLRDAMDMRSPDTGLVDEEVRLFRHLFSNHETGVEAKLIVNSQATSNIATIIRRRMNTVFVLSTFRKWGIPFIAPNLIYTVRCRNITITDEISNTSGANAEDDTRLIIGFMPQKKLYDTHCYRHRADTIPYIPDERWQKITTNRLIKCPHTDLYNQSQNED